jgi:hypothetical protein
MRAAHNGGVGGSYASHILPDPGSDTAKGSFKLTMLETVAADPQMKPADLALVVAYCSQLQWPKRTAWLATSLARAKTGLSERQINVSRSRLLKRGYLVDRGKHGLNRLFELVNENAADMQMHVREATEFYREQVKFRQASRRAAIKAVGANSAATERPMSQHPGERDVPAKNAGNIPSLTPQNRALKREQHLDPFDVPASEAEATRIVNQLLDGRGGRSYQTLFNILRSRLLKGELTPLDVETLLEVAA